MQTIKHRNSGTAGMMGFILLLSLPFCKKNHLHDLSDAATKHDIPGLQQAIALSTGIPLTNVVYDKEKKWFIVDNDAYITLEDAQVRYGITEPLLPGAANASAQVMSHYSIDPFKVGDIRIYADSTVPATWQAALDTAINNWNSTGSKVQMRRVDRLTGANTRVLTMYSSSSTIALANYPDAYGNPGKKIYVNTYYNRMPELRKIFVTTHELGHIIGLSHTDGTNGYQIEGTPTTDSASVMNSIYTDWAGYSEYDLAAVRTVYPQ